MNLFVYVMKHFLFLVCYFIFLISNFYSLKKPSELMNSKQYNTSEFAFKLIIITAVVVFSTQPMVLCCYDA